jgi:hypothetical protein
MLCMVKNSHTNLERACYLLIRNTLFYDKETSSSGLKWGGSAYNKVNVACKCLIYSNMCANFGILAIICL